MSSYSAEEEQEEHLSTRRRRTRPTTSASTTTPSHRSKRSKLHLHPPSSPDLSPSESDYSLSSPSEEDFESDRDSSLSLSTGEKQTNKRKRRRNKSAATSTSTSTSTTIKPLTSIQLISIKESWNLFLEKLDEVDPTWRERSSSHGAEGKGKRKVGGGGGGGGHQGWEPRLGLAEIRRLAIVTGVKMSEKEMEEMLTFACESFAPATSRYITPQGARAQRLQAAAAAAAKTTAGMHGVSVARQGTDDQAKSGYEGGVGLDEFAGVLRRGRMI